MASEFLKQKAKVKDNKDKDKVKDNKGKVTENSPSKSKASKFLQEKAGVNGKQSNSSASTKSTKITSIDNNSTKQSVGNRTTNFLPSLIGTGLSVAANSAQQSKYEVETNNAYANVKDNMSNKTTISNGLSDEERKSRIKEIESEMRQLNYTLQGLGRATSYGTDSDWIAKKGEEVRKRKEELSKELTSLKREGTHTASDMVQFEIEDAKAEKAKLPNYNPTARVAPSEVEQFKKNVTAHHEAKEKIDVLERQKDLYDNISEYSGVVHQEKDVSSEDLGFWEKQAAYANNFNSQWRANYRSNELSREADKAMSEYLRNPTEENRQIAYAYDALAREYMKNNEDALDDEGAVLPWFSRDLAGYLPQFKDQIGPEIMGNILGRIFTRGSNIGGAFGAAIANYSQSYDVIRGSVYRTLLAEGVDEETARQAAEDEALISSLIESGETAASWLLAGSSKAWGAIKGAAQTSVAKGSTNGAVKFIAGLGAKGTKRAATKAVKAVATPMRKTGAKIVGGVGVNGFTEYGEEFLQQGVSIANRDRLANNTGDNLWEATGEVIKDVATGKNPEALAEMHEAGKTGFKIGVMMGGSRTTVNNIVTHYANAKTVKAQNEFVDALINDDESLDALVEEGKASGEGSVSSKIATEVEEARAEGNVTREQVKKLIAANEVYIKEEERIAKATTPKQTTKATPKSGTPLHERLEALSQNNEPIAVEDVKKATGFGDNGSKLVATLANNEGVTFSQAERMVKNAYMAGLTNAEGKTANFATDTQIDAFTAGKQDRVMQELADKANAEDAVVNKKAGFVAKNLPSDVTQSQVEVLDLMSKALGYKSFVKKGLKGNAEIRHDTGEVAIDFDFEREVGPVDNRQKVSIVFHAAHEIALHGVVKRAPVEGRAFVYAMYKHLAGDEPSVITLADEKRSDYAEQGVNISLATAMEEISANNILYLYGNDEGKFRNAIESIVNGNDTKAKQGLQKYIEYLKEIIRKIRNYIAKKTGKARAELQAELDEVTKLRDMFESAVAKAVENTKSKQSENVQAKAESKLNYSLKQFPDGKLFVDVDVDQALFDGKSLKEQALLAREIIKERFAGKVIGNINKVFVNGNSAEEYSWIRRSRNDANTEAKMRASTELDNLIDAGTNFRNSPDGEYGHIHEDAVDGFSYFDVIFKVGTEYYTGIVNVINNSRGRLLKDVTQIKNITDDVTASYGENPASSVVSDVSKDKIPQNPKYVKRDFSLKEKAPTFYSHMGKTIDDMKQDKIGASSVVSYLTGRGVKAEEIKWSGIETFLEGKKSVTKAELQEFVAGSMLQIEEKVLSEEEASNFKYEYTDFEKSQLDSLEENLQESWEEIDSAWQEMFGEEIAWDIRYNDNATRLIRRELNKRESHRNNPHYEQVVNSLDDIELWESQRDQIVANAKERTKEVIAPKWSEYKLEGGENYREMLFKMPASIYSNSAMSTHWGNVKGVLAHARIQDFDVNGEKMLFIEEIQSDWHNEGQSRGYKAKLSPSEEKNIKDIQDKRSYLFNELQDVLEEIRVTAERAEKQNLTAQQQVEATSALWDKANKLRDEERALAARVEKINGTGNVPDAPFRNNYHEYVLKRLIRIAAEEGYDSIGWTPADVQSERWSDEYAEGYRIEYDQDIPKFLNKYGKKWGTKVEKTVIGKEEGHWEEKARWVEKEGTEIWTMPITDSMKESVLYEGQPQFSLKKPVEETKDLIAVHNTTADKLLGALKLGGLPAPSIAITKKDMSHENFGDISMVFRKDSISPTDRRNKIYSGDAYTPTGVRVEYDIDDDILQEFNKKLKDLTPEWANERLPSVDSGTANAENDSLYNAYERNDRAKLAFLREKGKAPKVAMRTPRLSNFVSNDTVIALAKAFSAKQLSEIANTSEGLKQYKNAFLKVIRDTEDSRVVEHGIYSAEAVHNFDIEETARKAAKVKENKYKIKKEVDNRATYELIDKKFTKALKAEYRAWIDENTKDAIVDKGIRNNRDLFTPSGSRRSFKQLHDPYNLSNIIKQMFSGEDKGIALFGGSPIGAAQHEYSSIADVKADSGRIQQLEQEEYDKIRDQIEADVLELAQKMKIRSDVFAIRDLLSEAIGKKTKQQADAYLKRESQGWANYSPEFTNELWDIKGRILNMPTGYFEAKPQRAVGFNEVVLAVLPKGMTELRKKLEDAGVQKVVYYDKAKDGDRHKKVNSVPDVNFSLKNTNNTDTKDRKELLDIIEHLKGEFEVTKFAKADPKKLTKLTKDLLKEYSSKADFDETRSAIDELYTYMANGENGHTAVWEDVYNRAYTVAQNIVENSLVVDDEMYQHYKSLRDYLRTTPMKFDTRYDSVPSSYENFNEFRKLNMGRLKFTNDGRGIDSVYQELAGLYPEFFNEEEQNNASDQLERIIEVLDELQPTQINPFDRQISQVSMQLANDLTSRFFDLPQAKPTFADKAERRVVAERIKSGKKVEAVREKNKEKIKKLIESQKAKTKKQLDKIREQRNAKVKKEQEKRRDAISKMSEKQKVKVLRARIMRHTSDLSKKLVNPTDNQHIPYEMQGIVAKLLESINLESNYTYDAESGSYKKNDEGLPTKRTQAFNDLKKIYGEMSSSVVVDPDLLGENGWLSEVISLADKRIADMNSKELDAVWQAIRAIEASVSTANKIFSQGKFGTILEYAEALRVDNAGKKEKVEFRGVLGKGKKLATLDMLTPETYFHYLGSAGDSIFRMMRDAQDKHISIMKEVTDFTHKTLKGVDVNSLEKKVHTVKLGGEDVKLTTAQLMELYVLMKREQAREHILIGGILPDITEGKGLKLNTKAEPIRNLTIEEVAKALSKLTVEEKNIAAKLQNFVSTVLSEYGNEASMKVYNYEKFLEKNYWTIRTNKQEIASEVGKDTSVTSVANKGMAKGTVPHANTSVRLGSIFDTFASHSSDMATYAAWLGTSEDINRIRNFVFWEEGTRTGTVKGILDTVHGMHGSDYLQKLLTDVAIGVKGTDNMNPFDKLVGNYKAASVGANLRVVIQQPTAILRATDMISAHYLAEGAVRPLKGWEKAKKYAPIAQWKDWGHFDINTGRQMKDVLFDNASRLEKAKQIGMWGASMADSLAWGQLWNAVEFETKAKHKDLEVGSEEYYETVAKRFTEIVDHTQVVDGILQRSQIMRSPDALTKMATSFMGEPTKQYNMAISALYDAKNSKGDARKKAVGRLGRTALTLVTAGIINACAQSIVDALRDDDKEKDYWEKWLAAFVGYGEDDKFIDSNLANTFNPLSYVPFAKDILSVMQGYDVKRMDTESITKTVNAITNMYKAITGTGKYTVAEASAQLFAEVARLYGLPVANVKRDVKSITTTVAIESNSYVLQYRMEKAMLNLNFAGNSKNFMDILFNAYNNDREDYEYIYKDMLESGYSADKIESGMEERMKKAEGVEKASELTKRYLNPEDEKKYDSALKKVKSSNVWKSANASQRKEAEAALYDFVTSTSETWEKTRAEAKSSGVDETEYTLYQLAVEMADEPKGQKGSGNYSYAEKADAINSLNLGDREIAYFIGKGLTESAKEEVNEALELGIDMEEYVNFKAFVSETEADKNANGNSIPNSKKRKVVNYLNNANLTSDEWEYFYYEVMNYKK